MIAGEGGEHADRETGKPMTFYIGDQHGAFSYAREGHEEPLGITQGKIMQHHRRDDEIEAAGAERKSEGVAADVVDLGESAREDGGARHRLDMAIEGNDAERAAYLAPPQRQRPRDVAAAAADVKDPEFALRERRSEPSQIENDALRATTEAIGGGQLIKRTPCGLGSGSQIPHSFKARRSSPSRHEVVEKLAKWLRLAYET